jgi:5-bromo-4-chloroindolyl phosphate hydrolysis protein
MSASNSAGQSSGQKAGGSALAALFLFAILCGLLLLLVGGPSGGAVARDEQTSMASELLGLTQQVQQAEHALTAQNYGACRKQLQQVQQNLTMLLNRMHSTEDGTPHQ